MIKKLFDKCVDWAGRKYANLALAIVSFIESSFFPVPPDVMIIPMVIAKKQHFIKIALIATIFSVLGGLFGYLIGYVFFNEIGFKIFQFYGYENVNVLKEMFSSKQGMFSWFGYHIQLFYKVHLLVDQTQEARYKIQFSMILTQLAYS